MLFSLLFAGAIAVVPPLGEAPTQVPDETKIEGYYACAGHNAEGDYDCVVIVLKRGDSYHLKWVFSAGETVVGIGQREGSFLWVAWTDHHMLGLCRYHIETDGANPKLVGDRGTSEVLSFVRAAAKD